MWKSIHKYNCEYVLQYAVALLKIMSSARGWHLYTCNTCTYAIIFSSTQSCTPLTFYYFSSILFSCKWSFSISGMEYIAVVKTRPQMDGFCHLCSSFLLHVHSRQLIVFLWVSHFFAILHLLDCIDEYFKAMALFVSLLCANIVSHKYSIIKRNRNNSTRLDSEKCV